MSEYSSEQNEYQPLAPLVRFRADMLYARSFYDAYAAFTTYLEKELNIPESVASELYSKYSPQLPGTELFEDDYELAIEQMRLGLIRVILPIVENLINSDEDFHQWLLTAASVVVGIRDGEDRRHANGQCLPNVPGRQPFMCAIAPNCPIKVTKHALVIDCLDVDITSLDYDAEWAGRKTERVLSKLRVAKELGLVNPNELQALRKHYSDKHAQHGLVVPETDDI